MVFFLAATCYRLGQTSIRINQEPGCHKWIDIRTAVASSKTSALMPSTCQRLLQLLLLLMCAPATTTPLPHHCESRFYEAFNLNAKRCIEKVAYLLFFQTRLYSSLTRFPVSYYRHVSRPELVRHMRACVCVSVAETCSIGVRTIVRPCVCVLRRRCHQSTVADRSLYNAFAGTQPLAAYTDRPTDRPVISVPRDSITTQPIAGRRGIVVAVRGAVPS